MSTQASIIMWDTKEHIFKSISVHYNGYPNYVGRMLFYHYRTNDKLQELMKLGNLNMLHPNISKCEPMVDRVECKCSERWSHVQQNIFIDYTYYWDGNYWVYQNCRYWNAEIMKPDEFEPLCFNFEDENGKLPDNLL